MSDHTTEAIKARLNLVEFIGSYVRLEKSGAHHKACCPFHQERTPSFMVNEEKNIWHCFGCGKGGDVFTFVMEMEGLEFREALKMLAERAGVDLPRYNGKVQEKETKDRLYGLLELATTFYEKQLQSELGPKKILTYLFDRGLSDTSVKHFRLGYAPDGWRHLLDFLVSHGFRTEEIEQAGLILRKGGGSGYYDRFRDRIMFPVLDTLGRVIGYSARVAPGSDETQAKYINTPETAVYHKSRVLYGLFQAKQAMKREGVTVVVEGNMDVMALHQAGIMNTVAVSGTALTSEQLTIMKRYGPAVHLFFDMDKAGQQAARKSAELALEKELSVAVIALASGKDAADMGKESPEKLREAVAQPRPALEYFLQASLAKHDRGTPDGKRKIVDEYAGILLFVKNSLERAHWIKTLAREIEMEEKLVAGAVTQAWRTHEPRERLAFAQARPEPPFPVAVPFGKRSEVLREKLVGFMYADPSVREALLRLLVDEETRAFMGLHPLYFFLLQAGEREAVSLIEDPQLRSEATRLIFQALEAPDFIEVAPSDLPEQMLALATRYAQDLQHEITKREKLFALERAISAAREKKDKATERELLTQFTRISLDKS